MQRLTSLGRWRVLPRSLQQALEQQQQPSRVLQTTPYLAQPDSCRDDHDFGGEDEPKKLIPWVRTVISGVGIMRHPRYNKARSLA